MNAGSALTVGRAAAEALMTATCVVNRISRTDVNGDGVVDDTDLDAAGNYVNVPAVIYTGRCRLKFATNRVLTKDTEGQILAAQELLLYLPSAASGAIQVDDQVVITGGGPDPSTVGRTYRITGLFSQTYATARRFPLESLS